MDCRIIFYAARKTSFCERALRKSFSELNLSLTDVSFATDRGSLGDGLIEAFKRCDVVFVIGGLGFHDSRAIQSIISHAVKDSVVDDYKKLKNDSGNDGYILRAQNQLLVLLPDEPEQIEAVMQGPVSGYIKITENARV